MKKLRWILWVLVCVLILVFACSAAGEAAKRSLTLMVYMCGSNLESSFGAATNDIREMMDAVPDSGEVTVLVMTGGSDLQTETGFFGENAVQIHEISAGKSRRVWKSEEPMNMGDPETVTQLIRYGTENYPAERTALILWDHGGGPLGGVCWDEMFSMDNLTLQELVQALNDAGLWHQRLSWIGFDACLMCSAEVASALEPYAEYMIASQETEPSTGWDYAFLREIGNDQNGAESGRRIIDAYFRSLEDSRDILTLSCVDLSRVDAVTNAMNNLFFDVGNAMNPEAFRRLSGLRMETVSFGKGMKDIGTDGYDLVDLSDLISRYGENAEKVKIALENAVVYSRSNESGVCGLSVYHPYVNKTKYLQSWKENYQELDFCPGYRWYVTRFGAILTEESFVNWSGLETRDLGFDEEGVHRFSLQLTPEQQADCVSAQLMILQDPQNRQPGYAEELALIAVEDAQMDESGVITAGYGNRILYVVDEENQDLVGPVSFYPEDGEEKCFRVLTMYSDLSGRKGGKPDTYVQHVCGDNGLSGDQELLRTYVYDKASEVYTNRIPFSEEPFTIANFFIRMRTVPDHRGALPGFTDWDFYNGYSAKGVWLPKQWHFRMRDDLEPSHLYAMFQITDSRQNTYSSIPIPIENRKVSTCTVSPAVTETNACTVEWSASISPDDQVPGVYLHFIVNSKEEKDLSVRMDQIVLNGNLSVRDTVGWANIKSGEAGSGTLYITSSTLTGLTELNSVEGLLTVRDAADASAVPEELPFRLDLTGCDVSGIVDLQPVVLGSGDQDGIHWELLSLQESDGGRITGLLYAYNNTDETVTASEILILNGVCCPDFFRAILQPHTGCYVSLAFENREKLYTSLLRVPDQEGFCLTSLDSLLQSFGVREVTEVAFCPLDAELDGDTNVSFTLKQPITLSAPSAEAPKLQPLLSGNVSAALQSVFVADNGIALAIRFQNDTDENINLHVQDLVLSGMPLDFEEETFRLPAHSKRLSFMVLSLRDDLLSEAELKDLSLIFRNDNVSSSEARIIFPEGAALGMKDENTLTADLFRVDAAEWIESPMLLSETIPIPEESVEAIRLTVPLSPDELSRVESVGASISFLGKETAAYEDGPEQEFYTSRSIAGMEVVKDAEGHWIASCSGLALKVNGYLLRLDEWPQENGKIRLSSNSLYFFKSQEDFQYSKEKYDFLLDGRFLCYLNLDLTLDTSGNKIRVLENNTCLKNIASSETDRTNYPVTDAELAVLERRVFHGADRPKNAWTIDYNEWITLPTDNSIQLELVPIVGLEEDLCVLYAVRFADGTRGDRLVDWKTGEILDQME